MKFTATAFLILSITAGALAADIPSGIEQYVEYTDRPASITAPTYSPDGATTLRLVDNRRIVSEDVRTGREVATVLDLDRTRTTTIPSIEGFTMSPDGQKIMVWRNEQKVYRRSTTAEYYIYDTHSRILKPLRDDMQPQRSPLFSPDGRMVAYVLAADNNIYLHKIDYGTTSAVTTDGAINAVINGVPDWTYEEEFETTCSMAWAPDSETLCYIKYNETAVPMYHLALYDGACNSNPQYALYPGTMSYKYPVAGEPNSKVTLHSFHIDNRATKNISLPAGYEYIPRIAYGDSPERLVVVTLDRAQRRMEVLVANPKSTVCRQLLVEQEKAWLDPRTYQDIDVNPRGVVLFSSRSGWLHLYEYSYTGQLTHQITSGQYDVTAYYGYDSATRRHFYQSTATGAINRVVCAVDAKGAVKQLSPAEGIATAWLAPKGDYITLRYNSVTTPPHYTLYATRGDKQLRVLEDNKAYAETHPMDADKEFFTFTAADGVSLNGYVVKPKAMEAGRRYPVVMYQYSGPGSQEVLNRWDRGWMNYFANNGIIVMCVDGRGTSGRGRAFMDVVYKNLGHYETIDQCAAARYAASLPYVDGSAIGIFGWSYGGYETLMAATTGDFDYAAAVAVAPVTSWRLYDTVYAERYMLTPAENPDGYRTSAPLEHVAGLKCPLLVMYGTADDNVHPANSIEYFSALAAAGKWADMLIFPNQNHSIYGCNSRQVLYGRMFDYFKTHLARR